MRPRLFQTPDDRWVLDASSIWIEVAPLRAANLLLSWGLRLPGSLALLLRDQERAETPALRLPLPLAIAKDDLVVLYGPFEEPIVLGNPKQALGLIPHRIIKTMIEAGDDGLSLVDLRNRTNHGGARGVLHRIAKTDKDWESVIQFPGKHRLGGYRIGHPPRRRLATATN